VVVVVVIVIVVVRATFVALYVSEIRARAKRVAVGRLKLGRSQPEQASTRKTLTTIIIIISPHQTQKFMNN
jgi:hypothetical protein